MLQLHDLIHETEPFLAILNDWIAECPHTVEVLPCDRAAGEECLLAMQVTTRSPLGALAYHTGGVLIADGWLRVLGAGCPRLARSLHRWNGLGADRRWPGGLLIADDAAGGFFSWERATQTVAYFAPDTLQWEDLELGYGQWLGAMLSDRFATFYEDLRCEAWQATSPDINADRTLLFAPPLWTSQRKRPPVPSRGSVGVGETWTIQQEFARQLA